MPLHNLYNISFYSILNALIYLEEMDKLDCGWYQLTINKIVGLNLQKYIKGTVLCPVVIPLFIYLFYLH